MSIAPIPLRTVIVDKAGAITDFFRLRWEELRTAGGQVPALGIYSASNQNASLASALLLTVTLPGLYRVTFTARRTAVDGLASSMAFTWHWTDGGAPLSAAATVNNTDTTGSLYSETREFPVDINTPLTFDLTYTSNTPGAMKYKISVTAELITQGVS